MTDPNTERQNILSITPANTDPVIYWHQVAMDAIHAKETAHKKDMADREELEYLKRYEKSETDRRMRDLYEQSTPTIRNLLNRVEHGDFSMNITLSFYPNTERKGDD